MNELKLVNIQNVCRVCLVSRENMLTFTTERILDMIEECTSVREAVNPVLPQQICNDCYWQLTTSYQFKQQYVLSVELLCELFLTENETDPIALESIINIRDKLRQTSHFNRIEKIQKVEIKNEDLKLEGQFEDDRLVSDFEDEKDFCPNDEDDITCDEIEKYSDEEESETEDVGDDVNQKQKSLAELLRKRYKIYDLTCNICKKELSTRATLLRHMETHSNNRTFRHRCDICNKGFYDRGNLNKHKNRHAGKADYKCEKCDKRYYELSALAVHNKEKHKATPEQCDKCSQLFYHPLQLQLHSQTHEQKEYVCDICGKIFNLKYKLKDHQIAHSEQRPHTCQYCQKGFKHKFTLTAHIKMRHEETNRRQMCFICGKLFVGGLAKHLESHDTTSVNKCEICDRIYTTKSGLQVHIKEKHTENREKQRYTCKICNNSLGTKGTLTKHMAFVHSEVRKACHICGKTYKTQKNVDQHISAAHMDIRPFSCTVCTKAFYTKVLLKNHMRSHTGERPFPCTICGKAFGYREVLKTHMKIHNK